MALQNSIMLDKETLLHCNFFFFLLQGVFLMEPGSPAINCTAFNHNGTLLLAGGCDGIVRLFGELT